MNAPEKHKEHTQIVNNLLRGEIDGRTKQAQAFLATRAVVGEVGHGAMVNILLQDQLSAWAIAQALVIAEIAQTKELLNDGELSPLFDQLQRCENSILKICKALQGNEVQQAKANGKSKVQDNSVLDITTLLSEDATP